MKLTSSDINKQHEFNIAEACARGLLEQPNLSSERWCTNLACAMLTLYPSMELNCNCEYSTENEAFKRSLAQDLRNTIESFIQDEL